MMSHSIHQGRAGETEGAIELQRSGLTLTEIAQRLGVARLAVVKVLYWDVVAGPLYVEPEIETAKLAFAGANR